MSDKPLDMFLIPSPRLGQIADVLPERLTSGQNEWITLSKEVLRKRREAAERGEHKTPAATDISDDHHELRPFGAQFCPALVDSNSIGYLLKWPANAVFKRVGAKMWEIHSTSDFYRYHSMSSFSEGGEAEAVSVDVGWLMVTPPGWSVLIKNLPWNLSGWKNGIQMAEGVVRADQATVPLQVHTFLAPTAPKEVVITRGEPMCLIMPFRRESLGLQVMTDPDSVNDAQRYAERDQNTFHNAPGRYRALYIEEENPSPLYPKLVTRRDAQRATEKS
ncbi:MAG TPA: DUF6065 family protein [bacterium]|nr:DUF6065 family protein [bacterium]